MRLKCLCAVVGGAAAGATVLTGLCSEFTFTSGLPVPITSGVGALVGAFGAFIQVCWEPAKRGGSDCTTIVITLNLIIIGATGPLVVEYWFPQTATPATVVGAVIWAAGVIVQLTGMGLGTGGATPLGTNDDSRPMAVGM